MKYKKCAVVVDIFFHVHIACYLSKSIISSKVLYMLNIHLHTVHVLLVFESSVRFWEPVWNELIPNKFFIHILLQHYADLICYCANK